MVIRRKGGLFEEIEIKQPPIIQLQIWDKDFLSPDDYLGALELNLSNLPEPYATDKAAQKHSKNRKRLNLFNHNSLHGWFQLKPPPKLMLGAPHDKHDVSRMLSPLPLFLPFLMHFLPAGQHRAAAGCLH